MVVLKIQEGIRIELIVVSFTPCTIHHPMCDIYVSLALVIGIIDVI